MDILWKKPPELLSRQWHDYLKEHPEIKLVRFVLFDSRTFEVYKEALNELSQLKK